jgi:hypothetical protein
MVEGEETTCCHLIEGIIIKSHRLKEYEWKKERIEAVLLIFWYLGELIVREV